MMFYVKTLIFKIIADIWMFGNAIVNRTMRSDNGYDFYR